MFRFHILGLLRKQEPFHGYALMKEYNRRTGRNCGAGYFYRQLGELMTEGLVRQAPNPLGSDARRTPYEITEPGLEAFDEWFEDIPRDPLDPDVERIARAMFFCDVEPDVGERVLGLWRLDLLEKSKALQRELQYARQKRQDLADIKPMLLRRDLYRLAADLEFLEEVAVTIDERRKELGESAGSAAAATEETAKPVKRKRAAKKIARAGK